MSGSVKTERFGNAKPIQTYYAGRKFRSRLEARWAVFFDSLGIRWLYEEQGFDLPSGPYLPDFFLPDCEATDVNPGFFYEIKPTPCTDEELTKMRELRSETGIFVDALVGFPRCGEYRRQTAAGLIDTSLSGHYGECLWCSDAICFLKSIPTPDHVFEDDVIRMGMNIIAGRKIGHTIKLDGSCDFRGAPRALDGRCCSFEITALWHLSEDDVQRALKRASSARFEHGERP